MNDPSYGILDVIQSAGVVGVLVVCLTAFLRRWVITAREHENVVELMQREIDKIEADRNDWRAIALGTTHPLKTMASHLRQDR